MLKAVLFDLDGTLLPLDTDTFMQTYLQDLGAFVQKETNSWKFIQNLLASTKVMTENHNPDYTNEQVFWEDFNKKLGQESKKLIPLINEFYEVQFDLLKRMTQPEPEIAQKAVQTALDLGLKIAVVTQPLFPLLAIEHRIRWAGVKDFPWDLITCYENSHFCKPTTAFYQETAYLLGVEPEECLMVGNDPKNDLVASRIGMKSFWINTGAEEIGSTEPDGQGSLAEFADWLKDLAK